MNPKEFEKYCNAYKHTEENRAKETDSLNWILGKYIAYAVNEPKKYPDKPYLRKETVNTQMTGEQMERRIEVFNKLLKGKTNGRNKQS